jgi:hypothetical protein
VQYQVVTVGFGMGKEHAIAQAKAAAADMLEHDSGKVVKISNSAAGPNLWRVVLTVEAERCTVEQWEAASFHCEMAAEGSVEGPPSGDS